MRSTRPRHIATSLIAATAATAAAIVAGSGERPDKRVSSSRAARVASAVRANLYPSALAHRVELAAAPKTSNTARETRSSLCLAEGQKDCTYRESGSACQDKQGTLTCQDVRSARPSNGALRHCRNAK
jgi:hypothetical protein